MYVFADSMIDVVCVRVVVLMRVLLPVVDLTVFDGRYHEKVWVPPPNFATRMLHMEKELMPKLLYDDIVFSMQCRGKEIMEGTKLELVEELHDSLVLEKKMLGARASRAIKELETQVAALQKRKKTKMADKILLRIKEMWLPLRDVQAEKKAEERSSALSLMHNAVHIHSTPSIVF